MTANNKHAELVVGFNIPAEIGMAEEDISTPALVIDLDAFEKNVKVLGDFIKKKGSVTVPMPRLISLPTSLSTR